MAPVWPDMIFRDDIGRYCLTKFGKTVVNTNEIEIFLECSFLILVTYFYEDSFKQEDHFFIVCFLVTVTKYWAFCRKRIVRNYKVIEVHKRGSRYFCVLCHFRCFSLYRNELEENYKVVASFCESKRFHTSRSFFSIGCSNLRSLLYSDWR